MKNLIISVAMVVATIGFYSFIQTEEWNVPASEANAKNPTDASDDENIEVGKEIYVKHCASCHGKEGYGDGTKAADLKGDLGDFSSEEFQAQTDGTIFYKMKTGLGDMPSFTKKIPDAEDRWLVIDYVRTLAE
tara:strand:- start:7706 stop:8104 length:399 start_codon:yes stop_codon:yes gene_type:complete